MAKLSGKEVDTLNVSEILEEIQCNSISYSKNQFIKESIKICKSVKNDKYESISRKD